MADLPGKQISSLRRRLGISDQTKSNKQGSGPTDKRRKYSIWLELAPWSVQGSKCRLSGCDEPIAGDQYRIALVSIKAGKVSANAELYHVNCFENIADLTKKEYLDNLEAVTQRTWKARGLKAMSFLDGNYLCDDGAEKLFLAWHYNRARTIAMADSDEPLYPALSEPFVWKILQGADLFDNLRPEEDGKWALYHAILSTHADVTEKHSLSKMLQTWRLYQIVSRKDESRLTEDEIELKETMSKQVVKAIDRLACIRR